jgi:hypothetical protein
MVNDGGSGLLHTSGISILPVMSMSTMWLGQVTSSLWTEFPHLHVEELSKMIQFWQADSVTKSAL